MRYLDYLSNWVKHLQEILVVFNLDLQQQYQILLVLLLAGSSLYQAWHN